MKIDEEKQLEVRRHMADASTLLNHRVSTELRRNPEFFGLITLELSFQKGRITCIKPIVAETIMPEQT